MNSRDVADFARCLPEVTLDHPFGPTPDVFKVSGRVFALLGTADGHESVSLKCDPDLALVLRQQYEKVSPAFHLNKKHWNGVALDGSIPDDEIREMIFHSYDMVLAKLPKEERNRLRALAKAQCPE